MKLNIKKFAGDTWGLTTSFSDYKYNANGELIQVTLTINSTHNISSIYDIDDDGNENYAYSSWENYYASDSYPHSTTPYIKRTFYNLNNLKGVKVTTYETSTTQSQTITYNFKMSSNEEEKTTYITKNTGTAVLKGNVVNNLSTYDWNNAPSIGAVRNYLESSAVLHQSDIENIVSQAVSEALLAGHPVGSIEVNVSGDNPGTYLGGTWESFGTGKTLVGIDTSQTEFNTIEKTGGEKTHTLTTQEMPKHKHFNGYKFRDGSGSSWGYRVTSGAKEGNTDGTSDGETGGGQAHNNLQPYITVYFWKRIN